MPPVSIRGLPPPTPREPCFGYADAGPTLLVVYEMTTLFTVMVPPASVSMSRLYEDSLSFTGFAPAACVIVLSVSTHVPEQVLGMEASTVPAGIRPGSQELRVTNEPE